MIEFDPRAWILVAGLSVAASCTPPSSEGDTGETSPECTVDDDCPDGSTCEEGVCEQMSTDDGDLPQPCNTELECATLELCQDDFCHAVDSLPPCEQMFAEAPPVDILEPVLKIAFVDVDDDDADELVVGTQNRLHVYETDETTPDSYPRGIESTEIKSLVGGAFDDMPGEDVMLLHGNQLDLHASDGVGVLATAVSMESPLMLTRGITTGAFDMDPATDLLLWGSFTAAVQYGSGELLELVLGDISSADSRDLGQPGNGYSLLRNSELVLLDIDGSALGSTYLYGIAPAAQASFDVAGTQLEIAASSVQGWTLVQVYDRLSASETSRWGIPENNVSQVRAGDLDGLDEIDEVAMIVDGDLSLFIANECLLPVPLAGAAVNVVFGDHDGDGDDELAVQTANDVVSIIDVE